MGPLVQRHAPFALMLAAAFTLTACQAGPAPTAAMPPTTNAGPAMHAKTMPGDAETQPEATASEGLQVTNGTIVDTDEPEQFD